MRKIVQKKGRLFKVLFNILDLFVVLFAFHLSIWLSNNYFGESIQYNYEVWIINTLLILTFFILFRTVKVSKIPQGSAFKIILIDILRITLIGTYVMLAIDVFIRADRFPAMVLLLFALINFISLVSLQLLSYKLFGLFRSNGYNTKKVVIIAGSSSHRLIEKLLKQKEWEYQVVSIVTNSQKIRKSFNNLCRFYPTHINLKSIITYDIVDEVICTDDVLCHEKIEELAEYCHKTGVVFRLRSDIKEILYLYKPTIQKFNNYQFLTIDTTKGDRYSMIIKSAIEMGIAFFLLFLISPALIAITILIKLTSEGPVIFKQERVGQHGRKFYIYKFRTMVQNAEALKAQLEAQNESDGPAFKIKHDPRITPIGRFLRKTNLDEVPQLFNVLRSEMSLIGPRPPLQSEVEQYKSWYLKRLAIKPGLTCTWQILPNRNEVGFEEWMDLDIKYIENWTFRSDVRLFFQTFKSVLLARGC